MLFFKERLCSQFWCATEFEFLVFGFAEIYRGSRERENFGTEKFWVEICTGQHFPIFSSSDTWCFGEEKKKRWKSVAQKQVPSFVVGRIFWEKHILRIVTFVVWLLFDNSLRTLTGVRQAATTSFHHVFSKYFLHPEDHDPAASKHLPRLRWKRLAPRRPETSVSYRHTTVHRDSPMKPLASYDRTKGVLGMATCARCRQLRVGSGLRTGRENMCISVPETCIKHFQISKESINGSGSLFNKQKCWYTSPLRKTSIVVLVLSSTLKNIYQLLFLVPLSKEHISKGAEEKAEPSQRRRDKITTTHKTRGVKPHQGSIFKFQSLVLLRSPFLVAVVLPSRHPFGWCCSPPSSSIMLFRR